MSVRDPRLQAILIFVIGFILAFAMAVIVG